MRRDKQSNISRSNLNEFEMGLSAEIVSTRIIIRTLVQNLCLDIDWEKAYKGVIQPPSPFKKSRYAPISVHNMLLWSDNVSV